MKLLTKTAVKVIPLIMGMTFMLSCKNEIEKIDKFDNPDTIPTQLATDISIMVSDSGYVRVNIVSPELRDFEVPDSLDPKTEFPKGLVATFYNRFNQVESTLEAGYAIYHINTQLFEATKDVVIKNLIEKQELHTQLLWWDQAGEKIWSDQPTTIITPGGTTYGDLGFRSDQSFSKYDIFKSSGQMNVTEPAKK